MEVELVKCECCGLKEDCTLDYINGVKAKFNEKWLCGLCSEAVRDELTARKKKQLINGGSLEDAVKAHMSFCRRYNKSNPAFRVADGMRQMLRRRSASDKALPHNSNNSTSFSSSVSAKKYGRSASSSQVGDESSFSSFY